MDERVTHEAALAGMEAFSRELEDENQHIEDAVRVGILVALDRYVALVDLGELERGEFGDTT